MEIKVVIAISILSLFIPLLFATIALLTPNWIVRYQDNSITLNFGFFVLCDHSVCNNEAELLLKKSGIRASFSLLILAIVLFFTSLGMLLLGIVKKNEVFYIPTGLCSIVASSCVFVSAGIYTYMSLPDITWSSIFYFGYSFVLAWASGALGMVGGVLALILRCTRILSKNASNSDCKA